MLDSLASATIVCGAAGVELVSRQETRAIAPVRRNHSESDLVEDIKSPFYLLQAQQNPNLALTFFQRLERFADQCSGTMKLHAAEIHRHALHRDAGNVARD